MGTKWVPNGNQWFPNMKETDLHRWKNFVHRFQKEIVYWFPQMKEFCPQITQIHTDYRILIYAEEKIYGQSLPLISYIKSNQWKSV